MPSPDENIGSPAPRKSVGLIGILAALGIIAGLTFVLHARVALSEAPSARTPLTVAGVQYQQQDSYNRPTSYLGVVVAGRKATLGFEVAGQLSSAPPREGTSIEVGQVIAQLDLAAVQARRSTIAANLKQARAELELAQLRANRQRDLQKSGAVSKEAYDESRLSAQAAQARVEAVSSQLVSIDIEVKKSTLVAPYSGVVADRFVYEGAIISPGTPVVQLLETRNQEVHVGVSAARAATLKPAQTYMLKLRDQRVDAVLLTVRSDVNTMTRATTAVFALPANIESLDGEAVTLELSVPVSIIGGWLPMAALLEGGRGLWTVLTLTPEGELYRTQREAVEVLDVQGDRVYVRGTLASQALIVANGVHRISPGTLVTLQQEQ